MKKWGFLLVFALFLVFIFNILPISPDKVEDQIYEQNDNTATENTQKIEITEEHIYQGNLLLVNSEYAVQQAGIKSDIVNLFTHKELTKGYGLLDNEIKLSEEIAKEFSEMIAAAEEDGVSNFLISSGYRDLDE